MNTPFFETLKKKQYLYAASLGVLGLGFLGLFLWSSAGHESSAPTESRETHIATAGERINPQEVWVERMEGAHKMTQEKLNALEKMMNTNAKLASKAEEKASRLEKELLDLRESPPEIRRQINSTSEPFFVSVSDQPVSGDPVQNAFETSPNVPQGGIKKIVLQLSNNVPSNKKSGKSTLENTLPAGTFARGVLLGGVDASTPTNAPSDPRPVLIRITDKGTLPRKFKSDLKDCHLLASCYGDLSSERVYMRLEKLTCTERLTGEISETQVAGYVVGEDGKAGVRGIVVDRTGPIVRNSLLGGFFRGMGKFFENQQSGFALPVMPFGAQTPLSLQQMLLQGATSGPPTRLRSMRTSSLSAQNNFSLFYKSQPVA